MATVITRERQISAPRTEVWRLLTDWSAAPTWLGVEDVRVDGPLERGARLTFQARGKEQSSTVEEVDPPQLLVLRSVQGRVTADYTYRLREVGTDCTEVSLRIEVDVHGAMAMLAPAIRAAIRRSDGGQLDRFVQLAQRSGPHAQSD
jgi:uncharacterized protein YndB with AHSA1/START domain